MRGRAASSPGRTPRAWRGSAFGEQTIRLRDRWLRLPRWVEGEPAGVVDVWGADWRGMRPRLLAALADPEIGMDPARWVTLESLAVRLAARYPRLLGPSFSAATARLGGEAGRGRRRREARAAALSDVIALELGGPFVWFGLTEIVDAPGRPRAIRLTETGAALAARENPPPAETIPATIRRRSASIPPARSRCNHRRRTASGRSPPLPSSSISGR